MPQDIETRLLEILEGPDDLRAARIRDLCTERADLAEAIAEWLRAVLDEGSTADGSQPAP